MIEHWVHLRCAGVRQAQHTYTWTCHLHRESGLTTHTNITPALQILVQAPYPLPTYTTHTTASQTQTHVQHTLCSHRIGKTQSSHPLTPSPPTLPRAKHIHISHTPSTALIPLTTLHRTSALLDTIHEPRVQHTCHAFTTTTPHSSPTPALPSLSHRHTLSAYTHATQTTVHASQSQQPPHPHRVPRQPHRHTNIDDHMTSDTTHGHRLQYCKST